MVDKRLNSYAIHLKDLQGIKPNDGHFIMIYPAQETNYLLNSCKKHLETLEKIYSAIDYTLWRYGDLQRLINIIKNTLANQD